MKCRVDRLLLATLILATAGPSLAQQPTDLARAVREFDPSLEWSGDEPAVRGDFNGDGAVDVAAVLEGENRRSLVVFHGDESGYVAYPLFAKLPSHEVALSRVEPGRYPVLGPEGAVDLRNPAVELVFPGRSSVLYVWEGGRYRTHPTERY